MTLVAVRFVEGEQHFSTHLLWPIKGDIPPVMNVVSVGFEFHPRVEALRGKRPDGWSGVNLLLASLFVLAEIVNTASIAG